MNVYWHSPAFAGGPAAGAALPPEWVGDTDNLAALRQRFGVRGADEFLALIREKDPQLLQTGMLAFGRRLEERGHHQSSAQVYALVSRVGSDRGLAETGRRQLEALQGGGPLALRFERSLGRLVDQATDYRLIVPMLAGSTVFQLTKNFAFAGLLRSPGAGLFTRGLGAEGLATLGAFGAEVSLFTGANRTLRALSGEKLENSLGQDWMGAAFSLAALKGFHYAGQRGYRGLHKGLASGAAFSPATRQNFGQALIPQTALFLGLLTAHRMEEKFGWRPPSDRLGLIVDVLGSQIALQVGSRLGRGMLGEGWTHFESELRIRGEGIKWQAARPLLLPNFATANAGPGPMQMMAVKTPLERLFGWVGEKVVGRPSDPPSPVDQLRPIFKQYPKLKKALGKSHWTPEQKLALLNMVAGHGEREIAEVFQYLPPALGAMVQDAWPYERQYSFLEMLALKGDFFPSRVRHIPSALTALRKLPDPADEKYRFLYELGDLAGPYADRVFANLTTAIGSTQSQSWPLSLSKELFSEIIRQGEGQAGVAMRNLDPTLRAMLEEYWSLDMKIQMVGILSRPAIDDMTMAWRFTDGFPLALDQMLKLWGANDYNFRLLEKVLGKGESGMDEALNFFPGSLQALHKLGWEPGRIYDYASEAAQKAGVARGKVYHWSPYLAHGLKARHLEDTEIDNLMLNFAERAPVIPELAFVGFLNSLFMQNASLKRWEN